jgi:EAL domain-containing protein (putative c-di-GMP-specific phosphodiesterase class I)
VPHITLGPYSVVSALQPILKRCAGGWEVEGFEGLARPFLDGKPLPPTVLFAPDPALDPVVVDWALRHLHLESFAAASLHGAELWLNFDPRLLGRDPVLLDRLAQFLGVARSYGIGSASLVWEFTENCASCNAGVIALTRVLRREGVWVAIDDFGAGASNLLRLTRGLADIIKIDRQWLHHMRATPQTLALLQTFLSGLTDSGVRVVLEGLELPADLELADGVPEARVQGFVLARPQLTRTAPWAQAYPDPRGAEANHGRHQRAAG